VVLVPVRTGTRWWAEATRDAALVRYLPARIRFGSTDGTPGIPGFDSAVLVYGTLTGRHGTVPAWCAVCKRVFWPAYPAARRARSGAGRRTSGPVLRPGNGTHCDEDLHEHERGSRHASRPELR